MPEQSALPLWAGRTAALLGIVLVALSLRQAVGAVSPILDDIRADIPLSSFAVGLLGALPPVVFALSGFVVPPLVRRMGLERALVLALALMAAGHIVRAVAPDYPVLAGGTLVGMIGIGFGNVLLPPLVRRYFPDRIALLTSAYACLLSLSAALPAAIAAPLAAAAGWRFSLGIWSVTALVALGPWLTLLARERRARAADDASGVAPVTEIVGGLWRSRVAVSITIAFSTGTIAVYAGFAWLPEILGDLAHVDAAQGGVLLSVFALAGAPGALLAPVLVNRLRNVGWIIYFGVAVFVLGYLGLIFAPTAAPLVWVIAIGIGPLMFPVCLVLINTRTRTHHGAVALSGFAQGIGYTFGALGPLLVGALHDLSGGWTVPLVFLVAAALAAIVPAITLAKPAYVEDELARGRY